MSARSLLYLSPQRTEELKKYLMNEPQVTEDPKLKFSLSRGMPYPVTFQMISFTQMDAALAGDRMERVGAGCFERQGW